MTSWGATWSSQLGAAEKEWPALLEKGNGGDDAPLMALVFLLSQQLEQQTADPQFKGKRVIC